MSSELEHRQGRQPIFDILSARGIKRSWLAGKLGFHRNFLYQIERGRKHFPTKYRARTAELLGLPESMLFRDTPTQEAS